jgi:hypothetical protein
MGAACAWKHRFFALFLVTSFGQAKEVTKKIISLNSRRKMLHIFQM